MVIAALLSDSRTQARVRGELGNRAELHCCRRLAELLLLVQRIGADVLLISPRDEGGMSVAPVVRQIRRDLPSVPIIMYGHLTMADVREVVALVKAGMDDVVFQGHDDLAAALRPWALHIHSSRIQADVLDALGCPVPAMVQPILAYCLQHAHLPLRVDVVARSLGVHRRTLVNRLAGAGYPCPRALITWSRLLVAARFLEDSSRSVEQVALKLGFGAGAALSDALRRYTGLRPAEVRAQGGLRCVVRLFRDSIYAGHQHVLMVR